MKILHLCDELKVPEEVLTQPISLLGNRGGGKTYGGMKIFELGYDLGVQCGAIDPIGKWWGLRLGGNGRTRGGLENVYIFGGKHADFPLQADKGAFIAKLVVEKRIHFVLDVSQMRKGERRRFLADFGDELALLKKQQDNPTPMILLVEEAHAVVPQKPGPDEARMLGAFEDIVREGRNYGVGIVLIDQRPATVNKNVLYLTEVLIALRIISNADRKVISDWIVQKGESIPLGDKLPFFKNGRGYLYAPVYELFGEIQILSKRTYDSTATVKIGSARAAIGALTPVDVDAVKTAMSEVLAEVEASDPKVLRRRVADLERQLAAKPAAAPKVVVKDYPILTEGQMKRFEKAIEYWQGALTKVADVQTSAIGACGDLMRRLSEIKTQDTFPPMVDLRPCMPTPAPLAMSAAHATALYAEAQHGKKSNGAIKEAYEYMRVNGDAPTANGDLSKGESAVLTAILQYNGKATKETLSVACGYKRSARDTYLSRLIGKRLVARDGERLIATRDGVDKIPHYEPLPRGDKLRTWWRGRLATGELKTFDALAVAVNPLTKDELRDRTNYKRSASDTYLSRLVTRQLVVRGDGGYTLAAELYG